MPQPTGGHSIDIVSITENAENIVVVIDKLNNGGELQIERVHITLLKYPKRLKR